MIKLRLAQGLEWWEWGWVAQRKRRTPPQPSRSPHFSGKGAVSTLRKFLARPRHQKSASS